MKRIFFRGTIYFAVAIICAVSVVFLCRSKDSGIEEGPACFVSFQLDYSDQKENHCQIFYIDGEENVIKELPRSPFQGNGKFRFKIPCDSLKMLRIDFGSTPGDIRLKKFRCHGLTDLRLKQSTCTPYNMSDCTIKEDSISGHSINIDPFLEIYPPEPIPGGSEVEIQAHEILLGIFMFISVFLLLRAFGNAASQMKAWNRADAALVAVFALMIALPMFFSDSKETSASEKRELAKYKPLILPNGRFDEQFQQNYTRWLSDHFACRDQLLQLNALLSRTLRYTCQLSPNTTGGRGGWFFDHVGIPTMENYHNIAEFPEFQMQETMQHLKFLNDYCEKHGKKFYLLFLPDKNRVYGEYFPAAPQIRPNSESALALFVKYLQKNAPELKVVYPIEALLKHKKEYPLYFKTDTHWTEMGGFWGGQELLETIRKDFPDLPKTEFSETKPRICAYGDLFDYSNQQIPGDWTTLYPEPVLPAVYQETKMGPITCIDNYEQKYKAFFVHDSFLIAMTPLLGNTFREVRGVRAIYTFSADHFSLLDQADIVVMETLERYLPTFRSGVYNSYELLKQREE